MNTSLESIVAAFGILLWLLTGTLTYWLICDADSNADFAKRGTHRQQEKRNQNSPDSIRRSKVQKAT